MKRFWAIALLFACVSTVLVAEDVKDEDLKGYIAGVTQRGKEIYAYDQAAWHGTDAFFALKPDTSGLSHYICMKTPSGWKVIFPKWNQAHDRLLIVYEARETAGKYSAIHFENPSVAKDDVLALARALELTTKDFGKPARPYNNAIIPTSDGNLYVYFYPGQLKENVFPIGGDVRYTVSSDGTRIVEKRQMHSTILDQEFKPDTRQRMGGHSHYLSDLPEDTDVLYALTRRPRLAEYVRGTDRAFIIKVDGAIEVTKPCGAHGPETCASIIGAPEGIH